MKFHNHFFNLQNISILNVALTFVLTLSNVNLMAQDHYYWYNGEKKPLQLNKEKKYILLNYIVDKSDLSHVLQVKENQINEIRELNISSSLTLGNRSNYWTVVNGIEEESIVANSLISYQAPFFKVETGEEVGLSHLFYVKLNQKKDIVLLENMASTYGVEVLGSNKYMPLWYTLACDRNSHGNALEMANKFYESGLFNTSQPDLMENVLTQSVNDPLFTDQWNLKNTGQHGGLTGSDIQVVDAWAITMGVFDIVTAVLDQGLEMNHPDLTNIHEISYDTESDSSPSIVLGWHGVPVAGIIGATTNNNIGVAGIAPGSQLMSISNSLKLTPDSRMARADGINFAWANGAAVINNSWSSAVAYEVIDDAIYNAVNQGRNGLGTVITFSTGNNDNSSISYPSSNSNVIAVGAVSMCDERTSFTSCDGQYWGSNYGTGLDVVAPGVRIPTTTQFQNYTDTFNGTSAAAPHVAGIAALLLSINSDLTYQEVRNIIEGTSEKIGNYTYTLGAGEQSSLTWNIEMGYGRVNAYKALKYTIENYGAILGIEKPQVSLPLREDINFHEDVFLAAGSTLTIEAYNTVTMSAATGTVTIGGHTGSGSSRLSDEHDAPYQPIIEYHHEKENVPVEFKLAANYPNPFNPATMINYQLPENRQVRLDVFDILGRHVSTLVNETVEAGYHQVSFDASGLSSGVYLYRIQAGEFVQTRKMLMVK